MNVTLLSMAPNVLLQFVCDIHNVNLSKVDLMPFLFSLLFGCGMFFFFLNYIKKVMGNFD